MSELASALITEAHAEYTSRLQAIEAHAGLIEEAEALAATLRCHGLSAQASGITFASLVGTPARVYAWVSARGCTLAELQIALLDADLRVGNIITDSDHTGRLCIDGLQTQIYVDPDIARDWLHGALHAERVTEDAAHG
jgi:hypothetical protein